MPLSPTSPSGPLVRPATEADLAVLQRLARRTIDARFRSFLGDEAVDGYLGSGAADEHVESHLRKGHVHCVEVGGDVAGLTILQGDTIDLVMIDVDRQREGLGKLLLAHAESILLERYPEIRLETFTGNRAAIAFYEACGWSAAWADSGEDPGRIELTLRCDDRNGRAGR